VLSGLFLLAAHARPPDLLLEGLRPAGESLSGRWQAEEADKLFWVEQDAPRLQVAEIVEGELVTSLLAQGVHGLVALLDYDGDGRANLVVSRDEGDVDLESGGVLAPFADYGGAGVGDIDGDGSEDYASQTALWLGHAGGLAEGAPFPMPEDATWQRVHPLGDLDGDGRGDLGRLNFTPGYGDPAYGGDEGTLDLHLGCEYAESSWTPHWRYDHPAPDWGPGHLLTAADLDGDSEQELFALSGFQHLYGIQGEVQILDDLLDPLGPDVISSQELGQVVGYWPGPSLRNLGDVDGDGDDELLALMNGLVSVLGAEPVAEGLLQVVGPSFDLPDTDIQDVWVGDYDGDGWRDVALVGAGPRGGAIALWLRLAPETLSPAAPDDSHCLPPHHDGPEQPGEPLEQHPPQTRACGCATMQPSSAWLLLALASRWTRRKVLREPRQSSASLSVPQGVTPGDG
jgi:hypothetical protein